jgi:large subunit ribosomal protein L15
LDYAELNLDVLQYHISKGRLDPTKPITMKHLKDAGVVKKIVDGVKILSRVSFSL